MATKNETQTLLDHEKMEIPKLNVSQTQKKTCMVLAGSGKFKKKILLDPKKSLTFD